MATRCGGSRSRRNKRSITIDFSKEEGANLLLELLATSDVLIENFRTGTFDRWGLGWERLKAANPNLIVLRVTGFGQTGPYATRAGFATIVEGMSGFSVITGFPGEPPLLPPFGLADYLAGVTGAAAVSMALFHRDAKGGSGQEIDLSLLAPVVAAIGIQPGIYEKTGELPPRPRKSRFWDRSSERLPNRRRQMGGRVGRTAVGRRSRARAGGT